MADQEKSSEDIENKEDTGNPHDTDESRADTETEESPSESELTSEMSDESDNVTALDASEADTDEASEVEDPESEEPQVEEAALEEGSDEPDPLETEGSIEASEDHQIEDAEILDVEEVEPEADDATEPPEIEQPAAPPPPPPQPAQGPSTFGLVFGGLLAGAIGFAVATFAVPEGWPNQQAGGDVEALEAEVARLSEALDSLGPMEPDPAIAAELERLAEAVGALEAMPVTSDGEPVAVDLSPVTDAIAGLQASAETMESAAADLGARLDQVDGAMTDSLARIEALEARPVVEEPDGSAAMEAQLEAFRSELDAVTEEARLKIEDAQNRASEIEQAAADAAATAARQAAISELNAALESGAAFSDPLSRIADAPEGLASHAETGVPTLAELREEFPNAARAALQATQTVPTDASATDRLTAFLRRQTNARSLSPQEGDSVDAILSRAEAALTGGDLETALSEAAALSEDALAAMNGWIAGASARQQAVSAAAQLN